MVQIPKINRITTAHGGGGRLTQQLTQAVLSHFDAQGFQFEDCAFITDELAVTTDGFTVSPREFPGGDIGKLAVCGAANDLAVRGVRPMMMTMSLIIEEGLEMAALDLYMASAGRTAREAGIRLAAGDTKVVPHGMADGLFITTTAIGTKASRLKLGANNLQDGDQLIVSTAPGRHGAALAAARFNLKAPGLVSDCALLWPALVPLLELEGLRCMRDCTRGGLGTVLCEWAESADIGAEIDEDRLPVHEQTAAVCNILGYDPLHLASEGCALIAVAPYDAETCLSLLRGSPLCRDAAMIGRLTSAHPRMVGMNTRIGGQRLLDMPTGEDLPRIC